MPSPPAPSRQHLARPLRPVPIPSPRPWAGHRLGPPGAGTGEAWLVAPGCVVGRPGGGAATLDELARLHGERLVGQRGMALLGARFPLIAKLIDAADWLSLQVHPSDELARELFGSDSLGKCEAWLILDAEPGTELVTGPAAGLPEAELRAAIAAGTVGREHCRLSPARPGDALLLRPGTLHAIGAGAFVYEIEQPSDLTFRVSDWGRPTGRPLHPGESLRAIRPEATARPVGRGWQLDGGALVTREFRLELVPLPGPVGRTPAGESLEVVTALADGIEAAGPGWVEPLARHETLVIPAAIEAYELRGPAGALAAVGSIP